MRGRYSWLSLPALIGLVALLLALPAQASTADHRQFEELEGPFASGE